VYIPPSNAEHRPEVLLDFVHAHPFGVLVTASDEGLFATHLPFVLDRTRGAHGTLEGHVARANPNHRLPHRPGEALVIFSGPDAYVTPSWYAAKAEHGRVVPTWNYVAVHAYGELRFVDDHAFLRRHLEALTARHERDREHPWSIDDAPAAYIEQLQRAVVGVELTITRLEGKWKMSQNRPPADIDGVVRGLASSPAPGDRAVAEIVVARRPQPAP
jgi:transcriptional regulator